MASRNPILKETTFDRSTATRAGAAVMTVDGTLGKLALLLLAALPGALYTWDLALRGSSVTGGWVVGGALIGLGLCLAISFRPPLAPLLAVPYAIAEGLVLGGLSGMYHTASRGIALQAVLLTFGIAGVMTVAYRLRWIRVTERFRSVMLMAIGAIFLTYMVSIVLGLFGMSVPFLHSTGPLGIGISVVFVGVAALSLLLDFDMIERGARAGAPKAMEWYGAFGLMVTLVWLYLEVLRLLAKTQSRR